jgi:protein-S-isoprenylcysteine O-methyltransferase Ste14
MRGAGVANPGLLRPPFLYVASIGVGLLAHHRWPVRWLPDAADVPLGAALLLVAISVFVLAVRALRDSGTPVPGNRPTTTLVRSGPYGFTRNPIYLAFTLLQLGVAALVNGLGVLVTLVPTTALIALVVVPREERYLEAHFPSEYASYKRAVRRWL